MEDDDNGEGIKVAKVDAGSAADQNGLQPNDVIVSAKGVRIKTLDQLKDVAASVGEEKLLLRVVRGNAAFYVILR